MITEAGLLSCQGKNGACDDDPFDCSGEALAEAKPGQKVHSPAGCEFRGIPDLGLASELVASGMSICIGATLVVFGFIQFSYSLWYENCDNN